MNIFGCNLCNENFVNKKQYENHVRDVHNSTSEVIPVVPTVANPKLPTPKLYSKVQVPRSQLPGPGEGLVKAHVGSKNCITVVLRPKAVPN